MSNRVWFCNLFLFKLIQIVPPPPAPPFFIWRSFICTTSSICVLMVHAKAAKRHYVGFIRLELYRNLPHPASARRHPQNNCATEHETRKKKMIALYCIYIAWSIKRRIMPRHLMSDHPKWSSHNGRRRTMAPAIASRCAAVAVNRQLIKGRIYWPS